MPQVLNYGLTLVTPPAEEPLSTAELKLWLRVTHSEDDALIDALGEGSRDYAEAYTRRQFVTATYDHKQDKWEKAIHLPKPPLSSVTSITYLDTDGTEQILASAAYRVNVEGIVGRITPAYGYTWPAVYPVTYPITIRFLAGYGLAVAVPEGIKTAIKMLVADLNEHREHQLETRVQQNRTARRLLDRFRVMEA